MRSLLIAAALLFSFGCANVDGVFFRPIVVDTYDFDSGEDPSLDGDLTELHPSIIDAAHREEGFEDTPHGRIHWVFARRDGASDAILFSHGNAAHIGRYWDRVERLWELGFHVLIYDYPGYGRSEGTPSEEGLFSAGQAALERVSSLSEVQRVWLYGYSLGGAPTYELAARAERGEAPRSAGLVSEASWCSAETLLQDGAHVNLPGHFATRLELDSCARASELRRTPLLILHGEEDTVVHVRHAGLLEAAASSTPVRVERVEGADHADLPNVAGDSYDRWILDHIAP